MGPARTVREECLMAKNDRRNSRKMKRRRAQAKKKRHLVRVKVASTEARKNGTKVKKLLPEPPPPAPPEPPEPTEPTEAETETEAEADSSAEEGESSED